jgi:hypothetical protein
MPQDKNMDARATPLPRTVNALDKSMAISRTAALRRLVSRFDLRDYTLRAIVDPERFEADDLVPRTRMRRFTTLIARIAYGILPGYLWILVKPSTAGDATGAHQ